MPKSNKSKKNRLLKRKNIIRKKRNRKTKTKKTLRGGGSPNTQKQKKKKISDGFRSKLARAFGSRRSKHHRLVQPTFLKKRSGINSKSHLHQLSKPKLSQNGHQYYILLKNEPIKQTSGSNRGKAYSRMLNNTRQGPLGGKMNNRLHNVLLSLAQVSSYKPGDKSNGFQIRALNWLKQHFKGPEAATNYIYEHRDQLDPSFTDIINLPTSPTPITPITPITPPTNGRRSLKRQTGRRQLTNSSPIVSNSLSLTPSSDNSSNYNVPINLANPTAWKSRRNNTAKKHGLSLEGTPNFGTTDL